MPAGRSSVPPGNCSMTRWQKAGIDRAETYVTNAVKHFKFVQRGKKRIHDKPNAGEIAACRWWQEQERALIRPPVTVALGATAARSLFGKIVTISKMRGAPHGLPDGSECWVTVHPSFLLRMPDRSPPPRGARPLRRGSRRHPQTRGQARRLRALKEYLMDPQARSGPCP